MGADYGGTISYTFTLLVLEEASTGQVLIGIL